ncbi:MAG: S-layer family protein [Polaromonas sp.]|nr:S-layer family protein [Polaromonas sp.]
MKNTHKSNSSHSTSGRFQRSALAAACAVAVGGFAVSGAHAQSMSYNLTFPAATQAFGPVSYLDKYIQNAQSTASLLTGEVTDVFVGSTFVTSSLGASPVTVSNNSSTALAIGNIVDPNLINLFLIQPLSGSAGILSGQIRGGVTTATQAGVTMGVVETAQAPAPITISGNTIAASTTLNKATSTIAGAIPTGYASGVQGSAIAGYTTGGITGTITGSVGLTSEQTAFNAAAKAGSLARNTGSAVTLDLNATTGSTASSPLTLTGNAITSAFGANAATNTVSATATASPVFKGTVAVNNGQANIETGGGGVAPTASIAGSGVTADITSGLVAPTTLTAALNVSGNTMDAGSTGNAASNAIVFAAGLDVTGNGSPVANSLINGASTLTATAAADLVLLNGQGNQGTRLDSVIANGNITVKADTIGGGGSISANTNTVGASSTGNQSSSLIAANSTNFTATAAAANSQSNDATPILATNSLGAITVGVGKTGFTVTGPVTASANTIGAAAQGSVATTALSIASTNFSTLQPGGLSSQVVANTAGFGSVSALSGASANNLQGNYGATTPIAAQVTNGTIAVNLADQSSSAPVALSAASVTLDGNAIDASASGNSAGTAIVLSGTNGAAQASVGNTQFNGNLITGAVTNSGVTLTSGGVAASALTLTDSTIAASALANNAVNSVSANVTNLITGSSSMASANAATTNGVIAQTDVNFGIASGQRNEASVSAVNNSAGPSAAILAGFTGTAGISANSSLTASDNRVAADTTGNQVANTLSIASVNLDTASNAATQIGGISSLQINAVGDVANATVGGSTSAVTRVGIEYAQSLAASTLTVSGNAVASTSLGNQATNLLSVAGGSLTSLAPTTPTGLTSAVAGTIQNEFALLNRQADAVGNGRTALTDGVAIGISNAGVLAGVSGSSLTVSNNTSTAEARNNTATNEANLTGFSALSSGAGLLNQQSSSTAVTANVQNGSVRISAPLTTVGNSSLTMTGNAVQALAVGSSADNSVTVQAGNLSGNASLTASGIPTIAGAGVLLAQADYNLVNEQSQAGSVDALASTPVRIMLGDSTVNGSNLTLSTNVVQAIGQATSAVNGLSLSGTNVTNITGELASSQTTAASVNATLTPEPGGQGTVLINALSVSGTPVAVTGNQQLASAGQNQAFNTQSVTATSIAGKALGGSFDFLTDNTQRASGSVNASSQPGQTGLLVDTATGGSIAVSGNTAAANANSNDSANRLSLTATSTVAATGLVVNDQATSSTVTSTVGQVGSAASVGVTPTSAPTTFTGTTVAVAGNTLEARADGNNAVNALTAGGASVAGGSSLAGNGFITANIQAATNAISAASTVGVIGATVGVGNSTPFSVTGNTVSAAANANKADSAQTLAAVGTLTASGAVANQQTSVTGALTASVTTATVGLAGVAANSLTASPVAVTGNSLTAQAGRNSANNGLAATGSTVTGVVGGAFAAGFNVLSQQAATGNVTATNSTGTVGVTAATATTSALSITGNRVGADANSNTATNTLGLAALGTLSANGRVDNAQDANGGLVAAAVVTTAIGVVSATALTTSPVAVTGNTLEAKASRNLATNSLAANAMTLNGTVTALPGFMVTSNQVGSGDVSAANTLGLIGALENAATGTSFSVSGNTAASSANVNIASNTLALNALSALSSTAQVSNTQTASGGAVTATTGGTSNGLRATVGVASSGAANALNTSPVTVSGNSLNAQGGGNTALNALEATAVGSIGAGTVPTFAVLNTQSNAASITTKVQFANIGAAAATFAGSSASVQSNNAMASGYGNSASNSIGLSALSANQNLASASVSNVQFNTASINTTVAGINIGVIGGGVSGGASTVTGNAIMAQAIGNSASNIIAAR